MRGPVWSAPCTPAGSAPQSGVVARTVEAMVGAGAHAEDISALLGPAVSGRNYEVPAAMADEVEAALAGQPHHHRGRDPGTRPAGRNRLPAQGFGCRRRSISTHGARSPTATLFSHRRDAPTGRLASLVWME